ncbi:MAG: glutathione S-transferase family protein [Pseudomonadota bacterium]
MANVTLYASKASRSLAGYWILEELGIPYDVVDIDIRTGKHKEPDYLAINPSGQVPAIVCDGAAVSERPAICAFLADRFAYGSLAPQIDSPDRGPYLKWLVYSTAVIDPAIADHASDIEEPLRHKTWGSIHEVVDILTQTLNNRSWLLGDQFNAADVAVGSVVTMAMFNDLLPENETLRAYNDRLTKRAAFQRAEKLTWPPEIFGS